ncbi:DUF2905 domain-containing protein [Thiovibrio sp. JS02]
MQKTVLLFGLFLVMIGLAWPWLIKLPFGRLPGDIVIARPGFKLYLPVTTMLIISAGLSLIAWLLRK